MIGDARLLSRPHRVMFAGWESTTTRLQQAGWSLAAEQNFERGTIRLAMEFRPAMLYMMSESMDFGYSRLDRYGGDEALVFHVRNVVGKDITIQGGFSMDHWSAIDAKPQFTEAPIKRLSDLGIFAVPMARSEEIIVEPATVAGLLEQIKKLQAPELAAIREKNRRAQGDPGSRDHGAVQRQTFHAQIVSLAA